MLGHQVGDRVGGLSPKVAVGDVFTCDANLAVTAAARLEQAITGGHRAHATAWYGLNDLAQIKAGDKVLIHLPPAV